MNYITNYIGYYTKKSMNSLLFFIIHSQKYSTVLEVNE